MTGRAPMRHLMRAAMRLVYGKRGQEILTEVERIEADPRSSEARRRHWSKIAWSWMVPRVEAGEIEVTGHLNGQPTATIIGAGLLAAGQPDFQAQTFTTDVGTFSGVLVAAKEQALLEPLPATLGEGTRSGRGGRKRIHDWTAFAAEVVRIGWEDGFTTRRDLTARMRQWCSDNFSVQPDDSTIGKEVAKLCPRDVPAE